MKLITIALLTGFAIAQTNPAPKPSTDNIVKPCPVDSSIAKVTTLAGPGNVNDTSDGRVRGNTDRDLAAISGAVQAGIPLCVLPSGVVYTSRGGIRPAGPPKK